MAIYDNIVRKLVAKTLKRYSNDVIVGTKNRQNVSEKQNFTSLSTKKVTDL